MDLKSELTYKGDSHHCQLRIIGDHKTLYKKRVSVWPFNNSEKIVDIWFAESLGFKAVKFEFKAPIGKIIGQLKVE